MNSNYDWSDKEHVKKKIDYICNTIILGNKPYDELPEIQRKDFDEYIQEYFNVKNIVNNHISIEEIPGEPSIYEKKMILDVPANAASLSLDFAIHPMIQKFYEELDIYSQQIEESFDKSYPRQRVKNNYRGFAFTIIILIATLFLGIELGIILFFIK